MRGDLGRGSKWGEPFIGGSDVRVASWRTASVAPVADVHHGSYPVLVIDPVDDPVGAAPRTEPIVQGGRQAFPDTMWLCEQRAWEGRR